MEIYPPQRRWCQNVGYDGPEGRPTCCARCVVCFCLHYSLLLRHRWWPDNTDGLGFQQILFGHVNYISFECVFCQWRFAINYLLDMTWIRSTFQWFPRMFLKFLLQIFLYFCRNKLHLQKTFLKVYHKTFYFGTYLKNYRRCVAVFKKIYSYLAI